MDYSATNQRRQGARSPGPQWSLTPTQFSLSGKIGSGNRLPSLATVGVKVGFGGDDGKEVGCRDAGEEDYGQTLPCQPFNRLYRSQKFMKRTLSDNDLVDKRDITTAVATCVCE